MVLEAVKDNISGIFNGPCEPYRSDMLNSPTSHDRKRPFWRHRRVSRPYERYVAMRRLQVANADLWRANLGVMLENNQLRKQLADSEARAEGQNGTFSEETHDLRNPLTALIANAQLLAKCRQSMPEETVNACLNQIVAGGKRMNEKITETIVAVRMWQKPKPETFSVKDFLQSACQQNAELLEKSGIALNIDPVDEPEQVYADQARLQIVLNILIGNACDAMRNRPDSKLSIRNRRIGQNMIIEVEDNGIGMSPEVREMCFKEHYSTKGTSGVGLFRAKQIIERDHQGKIWVESEAGKGTRFTLAIPREKRA